MYKILITLLTSYNEFILYSSYKSIINQVNHNLFYTIVIVVNSLNPDYYNDVCKKFKTIDVEIIQTVSNGKPGMGHNSILEIFKNKNTYDYLIPIDGDDFLYPYALHQLSKILIYNPTVVVGGNEDYICNFKDLYNINDCYDLNYKYFIYTQPNIPIKKTFDLYNNGTAFRLVLLHKSIFNHNIDKYYCEESSVFDDYLFYLHVINLHYTTQSTIYYITLKNIYFYYKAHISSACYQNSSNCNDDINGMITQFPLLINIKQQNILFKLPILYINDPTCNIIKHKLINNSITFEKEDFLHTHTYKLNYNFAMDLSIDLYNSTLDFIKSKLNKLDYYKFDEKKKLYLILENYILNGLISDSIIKYLLIISNNIKYIAIDIIEIILEAIEKLNLFMYNQINYMKEYEENNYINCYLITYHLLKRNVNKSLYYYYYSSIMKLYNYNILLNNSIITIENNNIALNNRKTIILLDYMDIDYILHTPFIKGLGGTQTAYIYLALELSEKYNVIILNKKNSNTIVKQHNIHIIKYTDNVNMINIINNINPEYLIYNFINLGELLRKNINNTKIKLFMYEHLTIYSNFDMKIYCDYKNYYDKIMFVSRDQFVDYNYYVTINKSKVIILNNTLSPLFYYNNLISNNISNINNSIIQNKKLNIIYISNPQRGLECFEYIFPILKKKYPNITLDIYSSLAMYDIEDNDNLKNMYNKLINIDGINYNKTTSQYELINVLNKSLLFIYPTFVVESFCNSMIEAMSCGCYIISTNIGALKSVAYPYGKFIDIYIEDKKKHPYYESIDSNYIDSIIDETCKTIELYLNNSNYLDNYLKEQIIYIKNMYKSNSNELFKHIY